MLNGKNAEHIVQLIEEESREKHEEGVERSLKQENGKGRFERGKKQKMGVDCLKESTNYQKNAIHAAQLTYREKIQKKHENVVERNLK